MNIQQIAALVQERDAMQRRAEAAESDWRVAEQRLAESRAAHEEMRRMDAERMRALGADKVEAEQQIAHLQSIIDAGWDLSTAGKGAMLRINELEQQVATLTEQGAACVGNDAAADPTKWSHNAQIDYLLTRVEDAEVKIVTLTEALSAEAQARKVLSRQLLKALEPR